MTLSTTFKTLAYSVAHEDFRKAVYQSFTILHTTICRIRFVNSFIAFVGTIASISDEPFYCIFLYKKKSSPLNTEVSRDDLYKLIKNYRLLVVSIVLILLLCLIVEQVATLVGKHIEECLWIRLQGHVVLECALCLAILTRCGSGIV